MDIEKLFQYSVTYGLGIVLSIAMACFMGWLLKYVLKQNETREDRLASIISKDITGLGQIFKDHDSKQEDAINKFEEAHRYQRKEHEEQKKAYERILEENERRRIAQVEIVDALKQINTSLNCLNSEMMHNKSILEKISKK